MRLEDKEKKKKKKKVKYAHQKLTVSYDTFLAWSTIRHGQQLAKMTHMQLVYSQ